MPPACPSLPIGQTKGMRFSLKDMFWSVTFASVGMANLAFGIQPYNDRKATFLCAGITLFGIALGSLCRKKMMGFGYGLISGILVSLVWAALVQVMH